MSRTNPQLLDAVYFTALQSTDARQSLRDLELSFNSHTNHHYHLGTQPIRRSTLADVNETRPVELYKELFYDLLGKVRTSVSTEAPQASRLIDSTTIDLNKQQFLSAPKIKKKLY